MFINKNRSIHIFIPGCHKTEQGCNKKSRLSHMNNHMEKRFQPATAINPGSFLQLPWDGNKKCTGIPYGKRQGKRAVHQNQSYITVNQVQLFHNNIVRNTQQETMRKSL